MNINLYKEKGFTLFEVLLSIAIMLVIGGVIATLFLDIFSVNDILKDSFLIEREVAATVRDIVQEVRTAGTSSTGGYLIEKAEPFSFAFYTNIDKDAHKERIHYFLLGTTLKKSIVDPGGSPLTYATTTATESLKTVLSHVVASSTSPIFSYFDKTYAGTTSPMTAPIDILDVRLVRIRLTVDENAGDNTPPFGAESEVSIRNLKYVQ